MGCGSDLQKGARMDLSKNDTVRELWKEFAVEIDPDIEESSERELMMCKKCFAAYERYHSLTASIVSNLNKALGFVVEEGVSAAKRARLDVARPLIPAST